MKYAIIGADGQVGREFIKLLSTEEIHCFTHNQLDVTNNDSIEKCIGNNNYSALINLAAFHNVNECEENAFKALNVNANGSANLAYKAKQLGCKVVYFSSDYVFGTNTKRRAPYLESDIVGPINVYGVSKVAGEQLLRGLHNDHLIIRTSSLFGACTSKKGWTFPEMIIKRATAGEKLKVVDDQYMSPTYTLDLVDAVIDLIKADAKGTLHITNSGSCTWYEFACETLLLAGVDHPIEAVSSAGFPSKARRPDYSVLNSELISSYNIDPIRTWKEALSAYLKEKNLLRQIKK